MLWEMDWRVTRSLCFRLGNHHMLRCVRLNFSSWLRYNLIERLSEQRIVDRKVKLEYEER